MLRRLVKQLKMSNLDEAEPNLPPGGDDSRSSPDNQDVERELADILPTDVTTQSKTGKKVAFCCDDVRRCACSDTVSLNTSSDYTTSFQSLCYAPCHDDGNSRDSTGAESGIVSLYSAPDDDRKPHVMATLTAGESMKSVHSEGSGAFVPVSPRNRSGSDNLKRKWHNNHHNAAAPTNTTDLESKSGCQAKSRDLITARRTPVKLLIRADAFGKYPLSNFATLNCDEVLQQSRKLRSLANDEDDASERSGTPPVDENSCDMVDYDDEPRAAKRPSLNFDKMREHTLPPHSDNAAPVEIFH